eukprot:2183364-Prorocentrum_lima.AAC.1
MPTSMVSPNLITCVSSPSSQGNVPALTAPASQDGGDHVMGTPYEAPPAMNWHYGQLPEARAVPQMFTPESH